MAGLVNMSAPRTSGDERVGGQQVATREDQARDAQARDQPEHDADPRGRVWNADRERDAGEGNSQDRGSPGTELLAEEQGGAHGGDDRIREVEQRHERDGRPRIALEERVGDAELEDAERGR